MDIHQALFATLPYIALTALVVGWLYRWRRRGFQVSSLSSQFLETRRLFWGTQPFHWGIFVVFLGHLAAFAVPASVLAWNGQPWRLLILEWTLFAFGLSALFGLLMLIVRRLRDARLRQVTTRMDMVLYALLLLQLVSGPLIAYFDNWGTSWFAAALTPYLRSIFMLQPRADIPAGMPLLVQLHVLSAFAIFGLIPFTRLIHFTVFPLNYSWRPYQQVIWSWSRRTRRTSRALRAGARPRNN